MKPTCPIFGHEMVLKDEKECYKCYICEDKKEGERLWCQSCWDEDEYEPNYCLKCVSDKGNHHNIIINETVT